MQPEFPMNIVEAINKGCYKTEQDYLQLVCPSPELPYNKAGSCAIVILIANEDIYIINVGDSRALGSISDHPSDSMIVNKVNLALESREDHKEDRTTNIDMEVTSQVQMLSRDHKPSDPIEYKRICDSGGYVYQT